MTLTLIATPQLTASQAEMLRKVYAQPGWQFQSNRPRCRDLTALNLLEEQSGAHWHVTQAGLDWLEQNP